MKLICLAEPYGNRMVARPQGWGDSLFFEGQEPAQRSLITLDLPGLSEISTAAVVAWVQQQAGTASSRSQVPGLPEACWRPAVLDDLLEAGNADYFRWTLSEHFKLEDFLAFADRWLPEARQRLADAVAVSGEARIAQLETLQPWLQRVFGALDQAPHRVWREHHDLLLALERPRFHALQQGSLEPAHWLELAGQVRSPQVKLEILAGLVRRLVQAGAGQDQLWATLEAIHRVPELARLTEAPFFWQTCQRTVRFEGNVSGETLDISSAQEQTVTASWPLFTARRVGRIIPGRVALVLTGEAGQRTYIAGGRELKFRLRRAGGQLAYMDNTLLLKGDEASLYPALLTVELLDTLANVDPAQALSRIADLNLPPEHPVFQAAEAARTDPRYSRVLADLLIELAAGLDADIARRLTRSQSARRRRR